MIRIAIVDDEFEMLEIIKNKIESVEDLQEEIYIDTYTKVNEVLEYLEANQKYDIIFSDIDMKNMNGIEFGEKVRKKYTDIYFIFLTAYMEYAAKSYTINAYQYILKSEMDDRLPDILRDIVHKIQLERQNYRIIKVNNDIRKIFYNDIIYIKKMKSAKYVQYYTISGEFRERITLEKVMNEITDNSFVLVERGNLVNIRHITRMKGNKIYLDNNEEVVISRARFQEVKKTISRLWRVCDDI